MSESLRSSRIDAPFGPSILHQLGGRTLPLSVCKPGTDRWIPAFMLDLTESMIWLSIGERLERASTLLCHISYEGVDIRLVVGRTESSRRFELLYDSGQALIAALCKLAEVG